MLKYEKSLHFDKSYERLQNNKFLPVFLSLLLSVLTYFILYYLLRSIGDDLGAVSAWKHTIRLFTFQQLKFYSVDMLYFLCGLILFCIGVCKTISITKENHSVQTNGAPSSLLTSGHYSKLRHPMYGAFILTYAGLFLSTRSVYGILVFILVTAAQYLNAFLEEKKLRSFFQEEYLLYCKRTKRRLMTRFQVMLLVFIILLTFVGLFN